MPKRYAKEFRRSVCERLVAGEHGVSILSGVLVAQCRRRAFVTRSVHKFRSRSTESGRPRQPGVSQIVEAKIAVAHNQSYDGPHSVERPWRRWVIALTRKEP